MTNLRVQSTIRLVICLAVAFSLLSIAGPLSELRGTLPTLHLVNAASAPPEKWYPAGPAMDTEQIRLFSDCASELNALAAPVPGVDLTDCPLTATLVAPGSPILTNPNIFVTSPIVTHGYFELEFMLANNFWGVNMDFGNNPNGVQLRQGISHLINKNVFVSMQSDIKGLANSIDSPVPFGSKFSQGGTTYAVTNPNSCNWDLNFTESGNTCTQTGGPPGGTAYNCTFSTTCIGRVTTGTVNFPWQPQIGSPDFCAAADHFVTAFRHAGFGTLFENSNCVLQGPFPSQITGSPVSLDVRFDDHARYEMGVSIAQEICGLFTGALTTGCNFPGTSIPVITVTPSTITSFCGFGTSTIGVNTCWWMYTAGFDSIFPIDQSLYFTYNSRFVSGVCIGPTNCITPPSGPCSSASVPTPSASDYMYLCNPAYDTASSNVEFAPSVAAAFSAATTAMDIFGHGAYTIPIWTDTNQNAYLNNWQRVINSDGEGIPNFFTWLNAYSPNPAIAGTIRQGFDSSTRSLSPYIATTRHDLFILNSIYDSPLIENPANNGQVLDWMTRVNTNLANNQLGYPQCSPPPTAPVEPCFPASTVNNLRLILRDDIFFQDGRHLTGSDVKFSYATLAANGAFIGTGLSPMTCARSSTGTPLFNCADGITVAGKNIVDIHLDSSSPFTNLGIGTTLVLPGRYWSASCPATIWDNLVIQGTVPDTCMTLDPAKAGFTYDPIANHVFIGSGSWECADIHGGTGATGFGCSDSGTQNPPVFQTYTLTRYGKGQPPAASAAGQYFRSSGTLALYLWSGVIGDTSQDVITASILSSCNNPSTPVQPLGSVGGCGHWQQGIGQRNGGPAPVTVSQTSIIQRFLFLDWVSPFIWASPPCQILPFGGIICTGPTLLPDGMAPLNGPPPATGPTLFEGTNILNPASKAGCNTAYPAGGYDC